MNILRLASKGEDVKILQSKLKDWHIPTGEIDGIYGVLTEEGVKELQSIFMIKVDGIVGKETYLLLDKLDKVKNFIIDEFRCKHCKVARIDINLLLKLEELRVVLGNKPIIVTSGYRCTTYNTRIGGIKNSEHTKGKASDIKMTAVNPSNVYKEADKLFNGVGKYNTFTHVDVGVNRYRWDKTK